MLNRILIGGTVVMGIITIILWFWIESYDVFYSSHSVVVTEVILDEEDSEPYKVSVYIDGRIKKIEAISRVGYVRGRVEKVFQYGEKVYDNLDLVKTYASRSIRFFLSLGLTVLLAFLSSRTSEVELEEEQVQWRDLKTLEEQELYLEAIGVPIANRRGAEGYYWGKEARRFIFGYKERGTLSIEKEFNHKKELFQYIQEYFEKYNMIPKNMKQSVSEDYEIYNEEYEDYEEEQEDIS